MAKNCKNILLVWDRIGDYHRSRWLALQKAVPQKKVFVADMGASDNLYKWENTSEKENQYVLLSEKPVSQFDLFKRLGAFFRTIRQNSIRYVCIAGYGRIEYILFGLFARLLGIKVLMFAESWYAKAKITDFVKGKFIQLVANVFFVSGEKAYTHFNQNLRIPKNKILTKYSVVDNLHFENQEIFSKNKELLCVARFSPEKNILTLVESFLASNLHKEYILKIVGGGPLKKELLEISSKYDCIKISDWVSYNNLPRIYQSAGCFILPSLFEPWGLVVNEAMAAGLPIVASEQCGCVPDLVDLDNGFVFDATSNEDIKNTLNKLSDTPWDRLKEMGNVSKERIKAYTPDIWANCVLQLLKINNEDC